MKARPGTDGDNTNTAHGDAPVLTRDEARRIAANIAKLPELLRGAPPQSEE